jgi:filamentous hemagglutinin
LRPGTIETFRNGQYITVETTESVSLFRKFGGGPNQAKLDGGFASTIQNAGRQETAVYPAWSNSRFEAELMIPEGQKLNIGAVGQQPPSSLTPKYRGGADQVLLPRNWSTDWVKSVRDGKTGIVYSLDEFKAAFPDQVTRGN